MALVESAGREARVLDLWERAVGLDRWLREEALLDGSPPAEGSVPADGPPQALGARNRALLALRTGCLGRAWPLRSRCPDCGVDCAFEVDSGALADGLADGPGAGWIDWRGETVEARAPGVDDLRAVAGEADVASAARALLGRCVPDLDLSAAGEEEIDALGRLIEGFDPGAAVGFDLVCPECGAEWAAMIDVGEALWSELRVAAERVLLEIDALARAYGWSEAEVMRLSPTRRAAYLQLVEAP